MLYLCYLYRFKPLRDHLRGFLIAAWAGDKIAEFSFPEISFHFPLRPWFFFVSPAYAGKRPPRRTGRCAGWDHPRVCGEKVSAINRESASLGSPPHVRGKVDVLPKIDTFVGITPACAGKRPSCWRWMISVLDHPRMCGEKPEPFSACILSTGSPPRMRGKD